MYPQCTTLTLIELLVTITSWNSVLWEFFKASAVVLLVQSTLPVSVVERARCAVGLRTHC